MDASIEAKTNALNQRRPMRKATPLATGFMSLLLFIALATVITKGPKPSLTLDEFFNSADLRAAGSLVPRRPAVGSGFS